MLLAKKKGFISTTFLIIMINCLLIITYVSSYIITSNDIYLRLEEFKDDFAYEAKIINEAKCLLANNMLEDFYVDNDLISVYQNGDTYILECAYFNIVLETGDLMILSYDIE